MGFLLRRIAPKKQNIHSSFTMILLNVFSLLLSLENSFDVVYQDNRKSSEGRSYSNLLKMKCISPTRLPFFYPGFLLIAQVPIALVATACVFQNLTETVFMAVVWSYPDLLLAKSYSRRLIKLNFKKNACLVKEYYWGCYQGKDLRIPYSTLPFTWYCSY